MTRTDLKGVRILVVEDDFYQASEMSEFLQAAGAEIVGPIGHAAAAASLLRDEQIDAAVLDINLGRGPEFDVARSLRERDIPFLLVTGYDQATIPEDLVHAPRLEKPVINENVMVDLIRLTGA